MAGYLKLVRGTGRFVFEPADWRERMPPHFPAIIAMWHGQHFMIPFFRRPEDPMAVMISRHGDGEINAAAVERFGLIPVRGSGAHRPDQVRKRGGAEALRGLLSLLREGTSVGMTADVPKVSRVAGRGIVTLAQLSGRPIIPVAVVTRPALHLASWDRTSVGLPFARGAMVIGDPVYVPRDTDAVGVEAARLRVQEGLDAVHARAYALVGGQDPGAGRADVAAARTRAALAAAGEGGEA
jgi:hypothetical protein